MSWPTPASSQNLEPHGTGPVPASMCPPPAQALLAICLTIISVTVTTTSRYYAYCFHSDLLLLVLLLSLLFKTALEVNFGRAELGKASNHGFDREIAENETSAWSRQHLITILITIVVIGRFFLQRLALHVAMSAEGCSRDFKSSCSGYGF